MPSNWPAQLFCSCSESEYFTCSPNITRDWAPTASDIYTTVTRDDIGMMVCYKAILLTFPSSIKLGWNHHWQRQCECLCPFDIRSLKCNFSFVYGVFHLFCKWKLRSHISSSPREPTMARENSGIDFLLPSTFFREPFPRTLSQGQDESV